VRPRLMKYSVVSMQNHSVARLSSLLLQALGLVAHKLLGNLAVTAHHVTMCTSCMGS
jgi:hypothetical protein